MYWSEFDKKKKTVVQTVTPSSFDQSWGPRGVQSITEKHIWKMFKNLLQKYYSATILDIFMQASLNIVDFKLFKPCPLDQYQDQKKRTVFSS